MDKLKIVVTGDPTSGKSEFIKTACELDIASKPAKPDSENDNAERGQDAQSLDYCKITVDAQTVICLFGAPHTINFDYMWEVLSDGCIGYIAVVDSTCPEKFLEHVQAVRDYAEKLEVPLVIAASKQDHPNSMSQDYIRYQLGLPPWLPVVPCTSSQKESVKEVLLALLYQLYSACEVEVPA